MKEIKLSPFDVVIQMPEDPGHKSAIICMYKGPNDNGTTYINGNGKAVLAMTLMFLENLKESFDQEQKAEFLKILGEHLVDMAQGVDGFQAMIIRKKVDEDDADEND